MSDPAEANPPSPRIRGSAVVQVAARIANRCRILGVVVAASGAALAFSSHRIERIAKSSDWPMGVALGAFVIVVVAIVAGAAFALVRSSQLDRIVARAKAEAGAAWVVADSRVHLVTSDVHVRRRFTFRARTSDVRFLLDHAAEDEKPAAQTAEPATPEPEPAPAESGAPSSEHAPALSEFPELPQIEDEPEIKTTGKPPFRVQGYYVAEFTKRRGDWAWKKALLCFVFAGVVLLFTVNRIARGKAPFKDDQIFGTMMPIAISGAAVVIGRRQLARSQRLQTITESALADPEAVWGVKDTWLYPLRPSAPRNQLSVTLDANEHRDIYKKPGPPKR
jgi:hypothetical protein